MLSSMASTGRLSVVASLLLLPIAIASQTTSAQPVGVCYGMVGNNLPPAGEVVGMYRSNNIHRMRIYAPNPQVFQALRGTNIELLLDFPAPLRGLAESPAAASDWVRTNILAHWPAVRFRYIAVGNEVIFQPGVAEYILPAMRNIYTALAAAGLQDQIKVSTSVQYGVIGIGKSYLPSSGAFNSQVLPLMRPIVEFLNRTGAPLLVNLFPYFNYAADPLNNDLEYAQFTAPDIVVVDGRLEYQNLFDAMVDAVYAALDKVGAGGGVDVVVSQSGWPSAGGFAATVEDARIYNTNLVRHVGKGTPKKPGKAVETYIFAMFNENQKQPAGIENNWGLFYPNKSPVYPISFGGAAAPPWRVRISVANVRF